MDGTELANAGDHPALNFLNTRSRPWGEQIELLASGRSFLDWLVSTDLIDSAERTRLARKFTAKELGETAAQARELREWLRGIVISWADGDDAVALSPGAMKRFNTILATDSQHFQLITTTDGSAPELLVRRHWEKADRLLTLPAASAADLLAHGDRDLIRLCDGPHCAIWFYDRTKSHRRRWCSVAVCGNRDKVKNHRVRAQTQGGTFQT
jgi:predicted RNA-binding Zn ribbon-like protein